MNRLGTPPRGRRAAFPSAEAATSDPASRSRRVVVSWCLYDFANSWYVAVVPATVWQAYYVGAVVGNEAGQGDLWWGRVIAASMAVVAITSPVMGALADHLGIRKRLLIGYALASVAATALLPTVGPGMILWGFALSVLANVGFEGSLLYYNAYLPDIAARERQGRVSGWGFATGYFGSLIALVAVMPLAQARRLDAAFLLVAAAYFVFMIPAWRWLPAQVHGGRTARGAAAEGLRATWRTFRDILRIPALRRFLLAYFLFEDGVNTVIFFSSSFAATTLGFPLDRLLLLFIVVQVSALAGSWAWARPTDRIGPKRVLLVMLAIWTLVLVGGWFVRTPGQFFVIAAVAGSALGPVQAAARTFMATLVPHGREGEFFGFYALCGKTASILGPLIFGAVSAASGGNQRLALLAILPLFAAGGLLLAGVRAGGPTRDSRPVAPPP